jgi:acyl-CoA oxidase
VADRLLSGRLCIAAMCMAGCKIELFTAIRYSQQRLSVGPTGKSDVPIIAYQLQQNAILPLLARTVVLNMGYNTAKDIFANPQGKENEIIRIFCATKCLISWHLNELSSVCRERCGGGGYLAYNKLNEGINGAHSGMTAEGDNRVLM